MYLALQVCHCFKNFKGETRYEIKNLQCEYTRILFIIISSKETINIMNK